MTEYDENRNVVFIVKSDTYNHCDVLAGNKYSNQYDAILSRAPCRKAKIILKAFKRIGFKEIECPWGL